MRFDEHTARSVWIGWAATLVSIGAAYLFGGPLAAYLFVWLGLLLALRGHFPKLFYERVPVDPQLQGDYRHSWRAWIGGVLAALTLAGISSWTHARVFPEKTDQIQLELKTSSELESRRDYLTGEMSAMRNHLIATGFNIPAHIMPIGLRHGGLPKNDISTGGLLSLDEQHIDDPEYIRITYGRIAFGSVLGLYVGMPDPKSIEALVEFNKIQRAADVFAAYFSNDYLNKLSMKDSGLAGKLWVVTLWDLRETLSPK